MVQIKLSQNIECFIGWTQSIYVMFIVNTTENLTKSSGGSASGNSAIRTLYVGKY